MQSFKSLISKTRYFFKPPLNQLIRSPFLPYEGNYELDIQSKYKKSEINQRKPEETKKPSLDLPISEEIAIIFSKHNNNLTEKSIKIFQDFLNNQTDNTDDAHQNPEILETIFLFSYLLDEYYKKLFNYPNLHELLKNTAIKFSFSQYLPPKILEHFKKELLKKILTLRYYSNMNLSPKQFTYILYAIEVASKPKEITDLLDRDLLITLTKSLNYTIDKTKFNPKEAIFLLIACNNFCFSELEIKNPNFNAFLLEILEITCQSMNLDELFNIIKELKKIPIEKTHFTQKEKFYPVINAIQKNLLSKFSEEIFFKEFEKRILGIPDFYFSSFTLFSKIGVISIPLLKHLENNFLKNVRNLNFQVCLIAFNMLVNLGLGENILSFIKSQNNNIFLEEMRNYSPIYLLKFLLKINILEIVKLWDSIKFTKEEELGYIFCKQKDLKNGEENTKEFFDSNYNQLIEKIIMIIIERQKIEEFSSEMKTNMFRIIDFLDYTLRYSKLKENCKFAANLDKLAEDSVKFYKNNDNNFYNQFNADVISILSKNGIKFQTEKKVVYRYCDIYLPEENIILELDGKFHFYINQKEEELVSSKCRNLFILMKNFRMLEINIFEWEKLREKKEMEKFLLDKLNFLIKNKEILFLK